MVDKSINIETHVQLDLLVAWDEHDIQHLVELRDRLDGLLGCPDVSGVSLHLGKEVGKSSTCTMER